jgi:hypothetical protein
MVSCYDNGRVNQRRHQTNRVKGMRERNTKSEWTMSGWGEVASEKETKATTMRRRERVRVSSWCRNTRG